VLRCIATGFNFKFSIFIMQAVVSQIECTFQNWGDWGEDREEKERKTWSVGVSERWTGRSSLLLRIYLRPKSAIIRLSVKNCTRTFLPFWGVHPALISGTDCHYCPSYVAVDQ
jgi:hypothetical protein